MKQTVSSHQFVEAFRAAGRESQFSRPALFALFDYLESYEDDCGVELELDPIGICCDWAEYESAVKAAGEYGTVFRDEESALEWLRDETSVIEFQSGVVIRQF
jgi:hypothetical protein